MGKRGNLLKCKNCSFTQLALQLRQRERGLPGKRRWGRRIASAPDRCQSARRERPGVAPAALVTCARWLRRPPAQQERPGCRFHPYTARALPHPSRPSRASQRIAVGPRAHGHRSAGR
eukprot:scaffold273994_cov28-Tisochrysis_lutea.AAC.5